MDKYKVLSNVIWAVVLVLAGSVVTKWVDYKKYKSQETVSGNWSKISMVLNQIEENYVDEIDYEGISEKVIPVILEELDPHSVYFNVEELKEAVARFLPRGSENKVLAQIFQALRIEVNEEMKVLELFLGQCADVLNPGGRLVVLSYHSLEDRLVKNFMKTGNADGNLEKDFFGNQLTPYKLISSKPILPSDEEIQSNNRARSAKLRVAERRPK